MRSLRLLFSVVAYFLFFGAFVYLVGFVGNLFVLAPETAGWQSVDAPVGASPGGAMLVNVALIALFGLQHSIMARPGFKASLIKIWPAGIERSLYVLATVAVLLAMSVFWQPIPALIWSAETEWLRTLLWVLFFTGWSIVFISTWLLNHFELFGLQQAWHDFRGTECPDQRFRTPLFYKAVRHPLYTGFLMAFWAIPDMSQGHLLLAVGMTIYILIAIRYEERDLTAHLGQEYADYRTKVGMLIPGIGKAREG